MENNFFTFQGKQYVIFFDHFNMKILRKEGDELISLTEEEQEEITNLLTQESGYQYYSDYLVQIVKSNDNLENKEYLYNFLQWLENLIPEESRENFYHNVKTLKTELNLSMNSTTMEESKETGCYNVKENKITMNKDSILKTWEIAKKTQNPKDFFWKSYSQTLLHELAHMASSNYNFETGLSLCGFDKFPPEQEKDKNRGLTEGFTEVISMAGVPGTIEIASNYYIEASFVNQLIQIVGLDVVSKSYFSNLGIDLLEKELCNIINNQDISYQLFRNIETNFQIRNLEGKQNILGNIQLTLLDFLEEKCQQLVEEGNEKKVFNILGAYEHMMITPEKLRMMQKNPDNYENVTDSIEKFKNIQEKFSYQTLNIEKDTVIK